MGQKAHGSAEGQTFRKFAARDPLLGETLRGAGGLGTETVLGAASASAPHTKLRTLPRAPHCWDSPPSGGHPGQNCIG